MAFDQVRVVAVHRPDELADAGLQITRVGQDEVTIPVRVVTSVDGLEPFDLVFVAVKTYQTEDAVRASLPATKAPTLFSHRTAMVP